MRQRGQLATLFFVALCGGSTLAGCGSNLSLSVRPAAGKPPELIPAPPLAKHAYRRVLVLPPETVEHKELSLPAVVEKKPAYYSGAIEKVLLGAGMEVISAEIVARAEDKGRSKMSAAEKAMVLGKKSKADAVLVVQNLSVLGKTNYYAIEEMATKQVDEARVTFDDGEPIEKDSERCLHGVPYYEVRLEAKLLDARNGTLLWVGSGSQSTIDVIKDDWVADVTDDCEILSQNFVYEDFMAEESTLDLVVRTLLSRVLQPMAEPALAGASLAPAPAPKPAPAAAPAPTPEPEKRMATVSVKRASLRRGPGKRKGRVMRVPRKAKVEVLETMGEWNRVRVQDGTEGWMHEDTLIMQE